MRNIIALIFVMLLIVGIWLLTQIPAAWDWINSPAWHWAVFSGGLLVIVDRLVRLTTWKGDDALWAIFKKDILGRKR